LATGSLALISDAAHSLLDVAATIFTYFAVRTASKPADDEHPYGHGKVESLAALGETAFLLLLSGAVAFAGIRRLATGETEIEIHWFAIAVLLVSIVIDAWRWWGLTQVSKQTGSEALAADALHFSSDLVNSVLVLLAFGAAALGFPQADALVAVGVAVFIALAGFRLARRTIETLIDTAPSGSALSIRALIEAVPGVVAVDGLRVRSGGSHLFADVDIAVARTIPLDRLTTIKQAVTQAVTRQFAGAVVTVTATPRQLDDETILERVLLTAARKRVPVHHVTVQEIDGGKRSVSLDLEVDGRLSLGAAHAIASRFESALRDELGAETEVETHIEPLVAASLEGRSIEGPQAEAVATALKTQALEVGDIVDIHNIRVRGSAQGLVVNYHCRVDPALDVMSVHARVDALEQRVRSQIPAITRIVSHTEPIKSSTDTAARGETVGFAAP
jgi:cation diffusion facilitator family transporter